MKSKKNPKDHRATRMPDGAPLDYAPNNEQGVVYLFSHLARRRFGLRVERVQAGFPDCEAYLGNKRIRIEFEYRSKCFLLHKHKKSGCDWIVCWIHDWPGVPKHIRVIELRKEFGLGFNVWFQPVGQPYADELAERNKDDRWSVPSQALEGDLLLFYRTRTDKHVRDIFVVDGAVGHVNARWKKGKDYMAPIRRVCTLDDPLHLNQMRDHHTLSNASFVRGQMRGRYRATEHWPELHRMIIGRNPSAKKFLKKYGPERLA